jgi:magnesium chelatase family protein
VQHAVSTALSRAPVGLAAPLVRVEVHLGSGLPAFALVGLPEAVVRESRERVRSALLNSGFDFPQGRITVNLSPADLPKEGGRFDLPIAVGILAASGQLPAAALAGREFYGELALGGDLRATSKLLPALVAGIRAGNELILPAANAGEAAWVAGPKVRLSERLSAVCHGLQGREGLRTADPTVREDRRPVPDLKDIRGQFAAKRALTIAAAGSHGMLMIGCPGAGKTLLAQRLPGLLPPLGPAEALEVASLESAAGLGPSAGGRRPFRNPPHTASVAAMVGGATLRPGEVSLAHTGVLFLDELPEFARNVLEALREPLESGIAVISRARRTCEFPARFQLVAAMNPCPCGYAGDPSGRCRCTPHQAARYRNRISGPLIDRIDMHVELARVPVEHLTGEADASAETSAEVAAQVARARRRQIQRQGGLNSRLAPADLPRVARLDRESRALVEAAIGRLGLSARAYHHVLKLARTCADLADAADVRRVDVSEAVGLRALDRAEPSAGYLASETM